MGRLAFATIDSTNAHGLRLAPTMSGPTWLLAGAQTAGRGRRARPWASPQGNFHATLVMAPRGPAAEVALRSFAAALALRDAFVAITGLPDAFALKWPNDVLLNGGKVAGILLESVAAGPEIAHLAIGIGANLIAAPDPAKIEAGAVRPVTLLDETGLRITPGAFLDRLAPAFAAWEEVLTERGFAPLRAAWLAHAARLGEVIRARTGAETRSGRFETIDDTGALILTSDHGRTAIPAAEVFF